MNKKYFIMRNGQYYTDQTKDEIYAQIDNDNSETFVPFLKLFDYPYIEQDWERIKLKTSSKVFGRYCSLMRLMSYRYFTFADSERLNEVRKNDIDN